jgi:hypothetical protein
MAIVSPNLEESVSGPRMEWWNQGLFNQESKVRGSSSE